MKEIKANVVSKSETITFKHPEFNMLLNLTVRDDGRVAYYHLEAQDDDITFADVSYDMDNDVMTYHTREDHRVYDLHFKHDYLLGGVILMFGDDVRIYF